MSEVQCGSNEARYALRLIPLNRCDSRKKLSSFHILPIDALVHPSAAMTPSTSSRKGCRYSGAAARSYSACVMLYLRASAWAVLG